MKYAFLLRSVSSFVFVLIFFGVAESAHAANICWDGGGTTNNWSEDANWASDTEPGTGDVAVFDNGTCTGTPNKNATVDGAISVQGVNIVAYTGTISQSNGADITLGSSGYSQSSSTSAFTGGDATSDMTIDTGGDFALSNGSFTTPGGVITVDDNWTISGGTFTASSGTVIIKANDLTSTLTGSVTFNNLTINEATGTIIVTVASGTTLTVNGTLSLEADDGVEELNGPGAIHVKGDITSAAQGIGGDIILTLNGTGSQTISGTDLLDRIPKTIIDKSSGTTFFSGTMTFIDDFTLTQGAIDAGDSTVGFFPKEDDALTITGSITLNNIYFWESTFAPITTIASGTTVTANSTLTLNSDGEGAVIDGPGAIYAKGNVVGVNKGYLGDVILTINGTGTQTITGEGDTDTYLPNVVVDKSLGTLNLASGIVFSNDFTYTEGTISPGSSTSYFFPVSDDSATITGSVTLGNVTFFETTASPITTIASGTNLTISGTLTLSADGEAPALNGPGTITATGNVTTTGFGYPGDIAITFSGTANQTFTPSGTNFPDGTLTINKSSGTVTLGAALTELDATGQDLVISSGILDMSTYALTVDDVVTVNGGLKQGSGNFTASNGNVTVGSTGWWVNNSTGDFVMDGGDTLTNNGYLRLDGTSAGCGDADAIALTRSGAGSVNLAGSGRWRVYDAAFSNYAASPAITVYSSTNTAGNTGITFTGTCPSERTWIGSGNYNTAANWSGTAVPGTTELAVFDATSTSNMTVDADPNDNGFQINLGYSGTITQSNGVDITLDDQGWEQNAGTFTGGDATSDMTLNNGGDFALTAGTFSAPSGNLTANDNWTVSGGTFNEGSGTVYITGNSDNSATITGSETFSNLQIYESSYATVTITIASGTTLTVTGTFTTDGDDGNWGNDILNGPGTLQLQGNIQTIEDGWFGNVPITINGGGSQTITGATGSPLFPGKVTIDKSAGSLSFSSNITFTDDWTYTQGSLSVGTSTVKFSATSNDTSINLSGLPTFYNLTFGDVHNTTTTMTFQSGSVFTVTNTLLFDGDGGNWGVDDINGPGAIVAQGDLTTSNDGFTGDVPITFSGSASNQTFTITPGDDFSTGTLTINKSSGTVTLGAALNLSGSGQDLTITDGALANSSYTLTINDAFTINDTFTQGTGNVSAASYTVGGGAYWTNTSTGDVTIGTGGVANSGTITLGDINTCGGANNIAITSSSGGQQRSWSGAGTFNIYDTTVQDQGGSASITAYSSQNVSGNGGNWTFDDVCPPVVSPDINVKGGATLRGGTRIL